MWLKSYFIFSAKSVLKTRGVDLEKNIEKNSFGAISSLTFAATRLKIGHIEQMQKKTKISQNGLNLNLRNLLEGIPNVSNSMPLLVDPIKHHLQNETT